MKKHPPQKPPDGMLRVSKIDAPEHPIRSTLDTAKLQELIESFRRVGQLQPILVTAHKDRFHVVVGHRRLTAARALKWSFINAVVLPKLHGRLEAATLHENLVRENVSAVDEAKYLAWIKKTRHVNNRQLAQMIHRTESWVSEHLDINEYPPQLHEALSTQKISFSAARELSRIKDPAQRGALTSYAVQSGINDETAKQWRADANAGRVIPTTGTDTTGTQPHLIEPPTLKAICAVCEQVSTLNQTAMIRVCQTCYAELTGQTQTTSDKK